jgi:hypothetical protein
MDEFAIRLSLALVLRLKLGDSPSYVLFFRGN